MSFAEEELRAALEHERKRHKMQLRRWQAAVAGMIIGYATQVVLLFWR